MIVMLLYMRVLILFLYGLLKFLNERLNGLARCGIDTAEIEVPFGHAQKNPPPWFW